MRQTSIRKIAIWTLSVIAVVVLAVLLLDRFSIINLPFTHNSATSLKDGVNYGPSTPQEKSETDEFKKNLSNTPPQETPPVAGTKKPVAVTVISWGQDLTTKDVDATGSVNGEISDSGTCTLTLKRDSVTVSQSRTSTANAQGSSCGRIVIPYAKLSVGTWDLTLSYSSASAEGTSSVNKLEVH